MVVSIALALSVAQPAPVDQSVVEQVILHPLYGSPYTCSEHWAGQLGFIGDALGTDCLITELVETEEGGAFSLTHRGDGGRNEDWFGYGAPVLAPFDGEIVRVLINPVENVPGQLGEPPASMLVFRGDDGLMVLYAHISDPLVEQGDRVTAGQVVAAVGNNGYSRTPHIHVGAWRDRQPLQIIWDLTAMAEVMAADPTDPAEPAP